MNKKLLTIALLSAISAPTFAEGMYGSLAVGSAASVDLTGSGQTASGTSYGLLLGYEINKYFAAEVGYTSLFNKAAVNGTKQTTGQNISYDYTANGFELAGAASWPISEQFSVFYRVGYAMMSPFRRYKRLLFI